MIESEILKALPKLQLLDFSDEQKLALVRFIAPFEMNFITNFDHLHVEIQTYYNNNPARLPFNPEEDMDKARLLVCTIFYWWLWLQKMNKLITPKVKQHQTQTKKRVPSGRPNHLHAVP